MLANFRSPFNRARSAERAASPSPAASIRPRRPIRPWRPPTSDVLIRAARASGNAAFHSFTKLVRRMREPPYRLPAAPRRFSRRDPPSFPSPSALLPAGSRARIIHCESHCGPGGSGALFFAAPLKNEAGKNRATPRRRFIDLPAAPAVFLGGLGHFF